MHAGLVRAGARARGPLFLIQRAHERVAGKCVKPKFASETPHPPYDRRYAPHAAVTPGRPPLTTKRTHTQTQNAHNEKPTKKIVRPTAPPP
jgi:hypothetical protein